MALMDIDVRNDWVGRKLVGAVTDTAVQTNSLNSLVGVVTDTAVQTNSLNSLVGVVTDTAVQTNSLNSLVGDGARLSNFRPAPECRMNLLAAKGRGTIFKNAITGVKSKTSYGQFGDIVRPWNDGLKSMPWGNRGT